MTESDGAAPVNVAVVGYGLAGKTFHAPLITATPRLRLHTVVSSDAAKVRADYADIRVAQDYAEVLADDRIDLVVIATPDPLHAPQATAALDAGKHVVVDKPFATNLADAEALVAQAKARGRLVSVFQNRRWDSDFLTLSKLIADGVLGEIIQFESHFDRFRPVWVDRWRERPGAGIWNDLGPHLVDQALQVFGPPDAVYADFAQQKSGAPVIDYFHVLLRYARTRVILHASQMTPAHSLRFAVHGTGGSFVKQGLDAQEAALRAGVRPGGADWGLDPDPGVLTRVLAGGGVRTEAFDTVPGNYPAYYAALRDAILSGGPPPVTPQQALDVVRVLDLGVRSAAARRELAYGD